MGCNQSLVETRDGRPIFRSPLQPQAALAPRASPEVAAGSYTTPWDASGEGPLSRIGASLLIRGGFPSLVAAGPAEYLEIAAALASDRKRRAALAGSVRQRLSASPLCDAPAYARSVEFAYRALWRHWCRGQG